MGSLPSDRFAILAGNDTDCFAAAASGEVDIIRWQ